MRKLFLIALFSFLMAVPHAFAIPDAPALVWFTGNENPPFDNDGVFTVNWEPVTNENILRYNIYPIDAPSQQMLFVGSNTTAASFIFSGYSSGNFTFKVAAVNMAGEEGPGTLSDWVFVKTAPPAIAISPPTPENNAYTKNNWTTIAGSVADSFLDTWKINWNGIDTTYNYVSGTFWAIPYTMSAEGTYSYYVWANDSAGNSIKSDTRHIIYDSTKPSIIIDSPVDGAAYYNLTISIEYKATDKSSISCWYEYNSINVTMADCKKAELSPSFNNNSNITIWASDAAGNINSKSVSFSANQPKAPVILSTRPENGKTIDAPSISGNSAGVISVKTDKAAQCKYSTTPNTLFDAMPYSFADGGSNVQNADILLTDKTSYIVYIRCMSADGAVALNDYVLQFSTASPGGLLILDPEGTILKNAKLVIEAMVGRTTSVNVPVRTRAAYDIAGFTSTASGDGGPFVTVAFPPVIKSNGISDMIVQATPNAVGTFKADINLSFGSFSSTIPVEIIAYNDISSELSMIEATISNLSESIEKSRSKGRNVDDLSDELDRIAPEVALVRSLYDGGDYIEARKKFMPLSESFNALEEGVLSAESGLAGNENSDANGSDSSIGGASLTTIVLAVIIVIILIIVATSFVSGKDEGTEANASPEKPSENPENYGFN